jgi:uncharacterized membrane protein
MPADQMVYDARREAAPALALAAALFVVLAVVSGAQGWQLLYLPWWSWFVPALSALVLLVDLWSGTRGPTLVTSRAAAFALLAVLVLGNLSALVLLVAGLVSTSVADLGGAELLLTGLVIWATNVVAFGLLFWEVADEGPVARHEEDEGRRDFQFPQDADESSAWSPRVWDYMYVSLTNSIAFSPTDTLPLTFRAKALMSLGSLMSAATVLLVAARAVNVLGT